MLELNNVYLGDCVEVMKEITNQSIDLVILDPPYFRILQTKWDKFVNITEYLNWSKDYLSLISDKIRFNGTLILFGCSRNFNILSSLNCILEKLNFEFIQEIIVNKGMKSIAGRISKKIKMLPPVTENIIVYRKNAKPFIKDILKSKQKELNLSAKQIMEKLGVKSNGGGNWTKYCGDTEFPLFPTEEHWNKLKEIFNINIDYKNIKETFNGIFGLTNVWSDIEFYNKNRQHPSEKPLSLLQRCINLYSDENNVILDPCVGSGTTCIAAKNLNRRFIGIEKEEKYYKICKERLDLC